MRTDLEFRVWELSNRVAQLEKDQEEEKRKQKNDDEGDWDNAKLQREWGISLRTTANYRKKGLEYFKRGGRIYYSAKSREKFLKDCNKVS